MKRATRASRYLPLVAAVAVAGIAYAWLDHINPEFAVTDDAIRDQLLVRDCVELGHCYFIGAPTSVPGVHQGAVWLDLLTAVRLAGGDPATGRTVVLALLAVAIGTQFVVVWRWIGSWLALPAAFVLLAAASLDTYPSQLINPSGSALPDVLSAAGLLAYGISGALGYLVAFAFALGLAVNVHVGAVSLLPSAAVVVVLASRRPLRDGLIAAAIFLGTCVLTSRTALLANVETVGSAQSAALLVGVTVSLLALRRFSPWFLRCSRYGRAWIVAVALLVPFAFGCAALIVWKKHAFGLTYLHPVLAPAAALVAALVALPFHVRGMPLRSVPSIAAAIGFASLAVVSARAPRASPLTGWRLADAAAIARRGEELGWRYEDLVLRLQGRGCRELLVAMSASARAPWAIERHGDRSVRTWLRVSALDSGQAAPPTDGAQVVPLTSGRAAVLSEIDSWLQPGALVACRRALDASTGPTCVAAATGGTLLDAERFTFTSRSFPHVHDLDVPPPYVASYEFALAPSAGESRDFEVVDDGAPGCPWRVTRVEGVDVDGALPAPRVRLHAERGAAGRLVVEKAFGAPACPLDVVDRRYPPCLLEDATTGPAAGER